MSLFSIFSLIIFLLPLANGQQLVRPLGRDTRCRGEIVFQKKPADLDDPENFLNSTSFSAIDCAVKCYQRVPGCRGVRYDHTKNICMYSSKDQGNCFRNDADPKVSENDRMLTMYCIQCIERNQTARTDKPNRPTPAAVSAETFVSSSQSGVVTIGLSSTTRSTSAPQTPQFAGQKIIEDLVPKNRKIFDGIDSNSLTGDDKLPVIAQQPAVVVQSQQTVAAAATVQPLLPPATASAASLEPAKPASSLAASVGGIVSSGTSLITAKPALQSTKVSPKVSRKPLPPAGKNQTAEYDYYYNENENETSSLAPESLDGRNRVAPSAVISSSPNISLKTNNTFVDELATIPLIRKVNALPEAASSDAFASANGLATDNKTSVSLSKITEIPLSSPSSSLAASSSHPVTISTPLSPISATANNISSLIADKNNQQPDLNSTTLEVATPPESAQLLHTFNETSGTFGGDKKDSVTDNALLIKAASEAAVRNSQQFNGNSSNEPISSGRISGQLNPIDLSSVTPDPSCREEDVLPCSKHFGRECIVVKPGRCPLCFCPFRSPSKGCAGPSGLSDIFRNELIQGKRNCPNGEPAQTVFRYERRIDKEKKFDNCIRTVQPYCGPEQDLFWQMPRFVNDCYYYCYTDKELRARGFVNITTYDRKL